MTLHSMSAEGLRAEPIRLSKRLAEQLGCSRREAERFIEGGWVTVNGHVVELPQHKVLAERIELLPGARADTIGPVTLLLNKPVGYMTGMGAMAAQQLLRHDQHYAEDRTGLRPVQRHFIKQNLLTALETDASGLLVFSQNWGVMRRLTEDASRIEHEYIVEVRGEMPAGGLRRLAQGQHYKGRILPPGKVSWQNENHLRFALKSPQPGQIRQQCEALGLQVLGLRRIRIGGVAMGRLPEGQWRYLFPTERL